MKKWEDLIDFLQSKDLLGKECCVVKKEEKKTNIIVWVLAIIGAIAAVEIGRAHV